MSEEEYWEGIALEKKRLKHNVPKQCEILRRLLEHSMLNAKVLEIGCGQAITAAAINLMCLGYLDYLGTELSQTYVDLVKNRWKMGVKKVTPDDPLPEGKFDQIWAFDVLEHIHPHHRLNIAAQIGDRLAPNGVVCINTPLEDEAHDDHDWGFDILDAAKFAFDARLTVSKVEQYHLVYEFGPLKFAWIEMCHG
jgi:SAM-dependent methyltransferase